MKCKSNLQPFAVTLSPWVADWVRVVSSFTILSHTMEEYRRATNASLDWFFREHLHWTPCFFCLTIKYRGFLQDFPYTNPMNAEPGPPGTGKSTTAAHLICQLLRRQRWGAAVGTLVAVVFFFSVMRFGMKVMTLMMGYGCWNPPLGRLPRWSRWWYVVLQTKLATGRDLMEPRTWHD